jgi:hypothetical protein
VSSFERGWGVGASTAFFCARKTALTSITFFSKCEEVHADVCSQTQRLLRRYENQREKPVISATHRMAKPEIDPSPSFVLQAVNQL